MIKNYSLSIFISIILFSCANKQEVVVDYGEVALLLDSNTKEVVDSTLYTESNYYLEEEYDMVVFDIKEQKNNFYGHLLTKDGFTYLGYYKVGVKPDTSKLIFVYNEFGTNYYKYIVEPEIKMIIGQIISEVYSDSLFLINETKIYNELITKSSQIMSEKGLILTHLKIDSLVLKEVPTIIKK